MASNTLLGLGLILFMMTVSGLAGVGIGVVIGLAIAGRDEKPAAAPQAAAPSGAATVPDWEAALPLAPVQPAPEASPQRRTPPAWSVALAIGIMVFCCCCTLMVAVLATVGSSGG